MYRLEQGNFSNVKGIGEGIFEYRVDFGPGYRIYFGKDGDRIVILVGGGTKKRQSHDIKAAKRCWQTYKARMRYMGMAITKDFRETVKARAETDPEFRRALLIEAVHAFLTRDVEVGKSILRDYINATVGFEELAEALDKQSKSLHRMLGLKGNPSSNNLFDILQVLQEREGVELEVVARQKAA